MKTVYVGLSGGVDSSVSAALLKQQGYKVVGVYMKNWSKDLPGLPCPWMDDYQDAKRVAVQLYIDFKMYDFEKEYQHKVVDYMLDEFKAGRTPNPDIMCNQEVKFKLFLNTALDDGADFIATGHYARVAKIATRNSKIAANRIPRYELRTAKDANKDQTYFLYRISQAALAKTIFPLGDLTKPQVRELAKKFKLVTADKKESMGICFIGKVGIKEFLQQYVKTKPGKILDQAGRQVGTHDGAIFYTIGQRHGLEVGGGLPYYVVGKDMKKNEVYVTTDLQDGKLWSREVCLADMHWINGEPQISDGRSQISVRLRHRAKLIDVKILNKPAPHQNLSAAVGNRIAEHQVFGAGSSETWVAELEDEVRALTPGQSAVFYSGDVCLGGGIVI